jgi:hypothetical protein
MLMKKHVRSAAKLKLSSETIQKLTDDSLRLVAGGARGSENDLCIGNTGTCSVQAPGCPR